MGGRRFRAQVSNTSLGQNLVDVEPQPLENNGNQKGKADHGEPVKRPPSILGVLQLAQLHKSPAH